MNKLPPFLDDLVLLLFHHGKLSEAGVRLSTSTLKIHNLKEFTICLKLTLWAPIHILFQIYFYFYFMGILSNVHKSGYYKQINHYCYTLFSPYVRPCTQYVFNSCSFNYKSERTRVRQLHAPFTATRLSILTTQYVFNSFSFNYKSDYSKGTSKGINIFNIAADIFYFSEYLWCMSC